MEKYTCMSSQHVLPSKQTLSNITKNRNICCHQCHLKYVKKFWANGKSKLPANFTCKHKVTSIGLKYDDRHAEIPKYRVPYGWMKVNSNNTFSKVFKICMGKDFWSYGKDLPITIATMFLQTIFKNLNKT